MNQIVAIFESTKISLQQYDAMLAELGEKEQLMNDGRPVHLAFLNGDKFCVIDVWNSEAAFMSFAQNELMPVFQKLGLEAAPPVIAPLHRMITPGKVPAEN